MIGSVIPRPIALITTMGTDGRHNAAPFSFFNVLTHDPALLAVGLEYRPDGSLKDTSRNIVDTGEFTVHIVDEPLAAQMEVCAIKFGPEVDELAEAGLATLPGLHIKAPRIARAPAAFECRTFQLLQVSRDRQIVLGEVVAAFIREGIVDPANHHIDQLAIGAIGRLGGHSYSRTGDQFEITTQTPAEHFANKASLLDP